MGTPITTFSAPSANCRGSELCPLLSSCVPGFLAAFRANRKLTDSAVWWAEGPEAYLTIVIGSLRPGFILSLGVGP